LLENDVNKINIKVKMIVYDIDSLRKRRKLEDPRFWLQMA